MAEPRTYHQFKKIVRATSEKGSADIILANVKDGKQMEDLISLYEMQKATDTFDRVEFADLLREVADPLGETWVRGGDQQGPLQPQEKKEVGRDEIADLINQIQEEDTQPKKKISAEKLLGEKPKPKAKVGAISPDKLVPPDGGAAEVAKEIGEKTEEVEETKKTKTKRFTAKGVDQLAVNLNIIAKELAGINVLLGNQLKNDAKRDKKASQLARKEDRDKRENQSEAVIRGVAGKIVDTIKKPFKSFFDRLVNFLKNIALGTAVVGFLDWIRKPENQQRVENFTNFIIDKIPLILGGIAAFFAIGLGLKVVGVITSILGAIKGLAVALGAGGLMGALGLVLTGVAGIFGVGIGMKAVVDNVVRPAVYGTDKEMADYKQETIQMARKAGINENTGEPGTINRRGVFKPSGEPRTPEQEKVWQEVQKRNNNFDTEKSRVDDIESRRQTDIQSARDASSDIVADIKENYSNKTSRGSRITSQGQTLIDQEVARLADQEKTINQQYDQERANAPQAEIGDVESGSTPGSSSWQDSMFGGDAKVTDGQVTAPKMDINMIFGKKEMDEIGKEFTPSSPLSTSGVDIGHPTLATPSMFKGDKKMLYDIPAPKHFSETIIAPKVGGAGGGDGAASVATAARNESPSFSPFDVNNPTLGPVLAVYNALV